MEKEAMFYEKLENRKVHCHLCAHQCKISDGNFGVCGVRQNMDGTLYTLSYGATIARNVDPVEKKPLYHFLPGTLAFSVATIGCNFHCGFCQNWQISQVSQDRNPQAVRGTPCTPEELVAEAARRRCASIAYTYTEPTIFFEYALDTATLATESGIRNIFVTNGYMSGRALEKIAPYLDAANVDLKAWNRDYYKRLCKARLDPVLDTIRHMRALGIWLEITTLIIPGENDSPEEIEGLTHFLAEVGVGIPWHISRFHPDYRLLDHRVTPFQTLEQAGQIGKRTGLRYIYLGNVPADNDTRCYACGETVVHRGSSRHGASVNLPGGKCPSCGAVIGGRWE